MEFDIVYILVGAFVLDLVFGDPRGIPHLIVGFGNLIAWGEKKWNKGESKFRNGVFLALLCVFVVSISSIVLLVVLNAYNLWWLQIGVSIVLLFYCLANKTLVKEGKAVFNELENNGLVAGRKRLSWIVGRNTSKLSVQQIRKATFETMAENLSDGVIAPLFYFVCFGVTGALVYKMINTLDSMIGYKSDRYEQFGKFSAKLDDVVNYIPARLTAVLMLVVSFKLRGLRWVFREGTKHSSPNAGYPEAALAYILSCQFGGPNMYYGQLIDKPFIGVDKRYLEHKEIHKVGWVNYKVSFCFVVIVVLFVIV